MEVYSVIYFEREIQLKNVYFERANVNIYILKYFSKYMIKAYENNLKLIYFF